MTRFKIRKTLEGMARLVPAPARNLAIDLLNPIRVAGAERSKSPKWVTLFITNYCNARCDHCSYWHDLNTKVPEISVDQLERTFTSLTSPPNTLRLSGGEPFLRKDIAQFFRVIDSNRVAGKMQIPTHGMLKHLVPTVTEMVEGAQNTHLNVGISLDGLQQTHDAFRKIRNGFDLAIRNMRELVKPERKYPLFNLSATLSLAWGIVIKDEDETDSELLRLIQFLKDDVGVQTVGYDHIRSTATDLFMLPDAMNLGFAPPPTVEGDPDNRHKRSGDVQLDLDEMKAANRELEQFENGDAGRINMGRMDIQVDIKETKQRLVDCLAGHIGCVIYPSGEVSVCEFTKPFANLGDFDFNFDALMHSPAADKARGLTRGCACTHPCHLSDSLAYDSDFLKYYLNRT